MANENNLPKKPGFLSLIFPKTFKKYIDYIVNIYEEQLDNLRQDVEYYSEETGYWEGKVALVQELEQLGFNLKDLIAMQDRINKAQEMTNDDTMKMISDLEKANQTIEEKQTEITRLKNTISQLDSNILTLQGENQKLNNANTRLAKENEELRKSEERYNRELNEVIGNFEKEGKITDTKPLESLKLENKFKEFLVNCANEYKTEDETIKRYTSTPNNDHTIKNRAKYMARVLGALMAYVEMDPRKDLNLEFRKAIMNTVRTEYENYSGLNSDTKTTYKSFDISKRSEEFMDWFIDAFCENRFEFKDGYRPNLTDLKNNIRKNNSKCTIKIVVPGKIKRETCYEPRYFCYNTFSDSYKFWNNGKYLIEPYADTPGLVEALNNDSTYKQVGGSIVGEPTDIEK